MTSNPYDLVYHIWNEMLMGSVAGQSFRIRAFSGGGRGRTVGKEERSFGSFSPFKTTDAKAGVRGGVIPPGLWRIDLPSNYRGKMGKPASRLIPLSNQAHDYGTRDYVKVPFLIHGRGDLGSDGCLVIEKMDRIRLLSAVERAGGATLLVSGETRKGDLLDKNLTARRTA